MKRPFRSIYSKMFLACSFAILVIEMVLLVISVSKKEAQVNAEILEYRQATIENRVPFRFTEKGKQKVLEDYTHNIFLLTILITLFVSAVVMVCFYHVVGKYLEGFQRLNDKTKKTGNVFYMSDYMKIPDSEVGDLIRSRDEMLQRLEDSTKNNVHLSKLASLGEMAGGIAHEINNPLAIISLNMSKVRKMLDKGMLDSVKFQKSLMDVDATIDRITGIVSGLRNISRDTSEEDYSVCKINDLLEDILPLCFEKFRSHGVSLDIDIPEELKETEVFIARVQLAQVLLNLLNNSFDEMENKKEKWIKLSASLDENNLHWRVTDSGKGIPQEIQEKIFEPFFTTKEVGKGTGLGLSLSHSLIKKHGGDFYIDQNSPNTCFVISLPQAAGLRNAG